MGWIILSVIIVIVILIILNSNIIILNKNFITFYEKFKGAIGAFIDFGNSYLERQRVKSAEPDQGKCRDQSSAPILIAHNANFIQRYRLLEDGALNDTMEVLDLSQYSRFNLVMLEVWVTRSFLKDTIGEVLGGEVEPSDEELLEYVPPIACAAADVYGIVDNNGAIAFVADYNSEIIRFNLEDDEDDTD